VPSRVFPLAVSARVQYQMPKMRLVTVVTTCNLSLSMYLHDMAPRALKMPGVIHCILSLSAGSAGSRKTLVFYRKRA
jgi:hypothetical protein